MQKREKKDIRSKNKLRKKSYLFERGAAADGARDGWGKGTAQQSMSGHTVRALGR
jgi:hypothetical protein